MKVLVINPGATSTKIAVFDEDKQVFKKGIDHSAQELDRFERVIDQADYRRQAILDAVAESGYRLSDFDAVCGRGGLYRPIPSGTYAVSDAVMRDVEQAPYGEHPSNLGAYLARKIGDMVGIPAFFVAPVCVDEMTEVAHYTGFAEILRPDGKPRAWPPRTSCPACRQPCRPRLSGSERETGTGGAFRQRRSQEPPRSSRTPRRDPQKTRQ